MTGESTASLCPRCRCKLLWNGKLYRCIACDFILDPARKRRGYRRRPPKR